MAIFQPYLLELLKKKLVGNNNNGPLVFFFFSFLQAVASSWSEFVRSDEANFVKSVVRLNKTKSKLEFANNEQYRVDII